MMAQKKSALIIEILIVLALLLCAGVFLWLCAPRGYGEFENPYTGARHREHVLWKFNLGKTYLPEEAYTKWAKENSKYIGITNHSDIVGNKLRFKWFGPLDLHDYGSTGNIELLYHLKITEKKKIKLLHEYQTDGYTYMPSTPNPNPDSTTETHHPIDKWNAKLIEIERQLQLQNEKGK